MPDYGGLRPHFQGYGTGDPAAEFVYGGLNVAGRGGVVYRINTTADNTTAPVPVGDGTFRCSLRRALETQTGPRVIVFETSGVFTLTSVLSVTSPYLTVAGQTAPSPGISIRGAPMVVETHDVLFQHLRFRHGIYHVGDPDSFTWPLRFGLTAWTYNCCIDHCSFAFANGYMSVGFLGNTGPAPWDTALLDSIIAYPLFHSTPTWTGYGARWWTTGINGNATAQRNLFVHSSHRNLSCQGGHHAWVNNVIYGSGPDNEFTVLSCTGPNDPPTIDPNPAWALLAAIDRNWFVPSYGTGSGNLVGTDATHRTFNPTGNDDTILTRGDKMWLDHNEGPYITGPTGQDQWDGVAWHQGGTYTMAQAGYASAPTWYTDLAIVAMDVADLEDYMVANVGARPADRDAVDDLAIEHFQAGVIEDTPNMGSRIDDPADLGVSLTLATNPQTFSLPANHNDIADIYGRTYLEHYLEELAQAVEGAGVIEPPSTGHGSARLAGKRHGLLVRV